MDISETVTFFNDMCCLAPATLIDERIQWLETNGNKVHASFTNNCITISAWLHFNEEGELINFISEDRYATEGKKLIRLPWSTPLKEYKEFDNRKVAFYADAVYTYPDGDFAYGNFHVESIEYNVQKMEDYPNFNH